MKSTPRRLTPLDPKEEKKARELERVLVDAGYAYADAMRLYAAALKQAGHERESCLDENRERLMSAGAALAKAALALQDVPVNYRQ